MHSERTGSGAPLVLVHGLGSSLRTWDRIVPTLAAHREVIAVDLPGFGQSSPLAGPVTIATLTDAVERFLAAEGIPDADIVGSSMGARMVLEMARRGRDGATVALDPGGFWTPGQLRFFTTSVKASVALIRGIQPLLPAITGNRVGRTVLLPQFSARPWKLPADLVLTELRAFKAATSLDEALESLARGPAQEGLPVGAARGRLAIGWGRHDKVTLPSQAARAAARFPDATLQWFDKCGHFPHWDAPDDAAAFILASVG